MTDLALTTTDWDLALVDDDLVLIHAQSSVAQSASITLKLNQGEWFLDQRQGLDRDRVHGKNISPVIRDAEYRRAILSTPGVIEILDLQVEFDPVTRTATPTFKARTVFDGVEPIEIGGDYDPLAFPPIEGCPLPEDGVYSGGVWQGPEPAAYQAWGWSRDLADVPEFEAVDLVGITREQIDEGLSVSGGALHWDSRAAVNAGANALHSFRLFPGAPFTVFKNEGFQFQGNLVLDSGAHAINNTHMRIGVEVINENGDPVFYPGKTVNRLHEGYTQITYSRSGRGYSHFAPESITTLSTGATNRGFQLAAFPAARVFNNYLLPLKTPFFSYMPTNDTTVQNTPDFRPIGYDGSGDYWRPFIEVKADISYQSTIVFKFKVPLLLVHGIPKT